MRIVVVVVLTLVGMCPRPTHGQGLGIGIGGAAIVSSGDGVSSECYSRNHRLGLGGALSTGLPLAGLRLAATGRYFGVSPAPTCAIDPFMPRDGTYIFDDHAPLQALAFGTTDLRLEVKLLPGVVLAGGGGMAWRARDLDRDAPYLVAGLGASIGRSNRTTFTFGLETMWIRFTSRRTEVTYENFQPIDVVDLGERRFWGRAVLLTALLQVPIP